MHKQDIAHRYDINKISLYCEYAQWLHSGLAHSTIYVPTLRAIIYAKYINPQYKPSRPESKKGRIKARRIHLKIWKHFWLLRLATAAHSLNFTSTVWPHRSQLIQTHCIGLQGVCIAEIRDLRNSVFRAWDTTLSSWISVSLGICSRTSS